MLCVADKDIYNINVGADSEIVIKNNKRKQEQQKITWITLLSFSKLSDLFILSGFSIKFS